jgi:hypothetical protein
MEIIGKMKELMRDNGVGLLLRSGKAIPSFI